MKFSLGVGVLVTVVLIAAVVLYLSQQAKEKSPSATEESQSMTNADTGQQATDSTLESGRPPRIVWRAAQDAFLNENVKRQGWSQTPEGLQYFIEKNSEGESPKPEPGSRVTVHYEGSLINGTVFDSSYSRGQPATFPLSGVLQGWQIVVPMRSLGEIWQFAIPADLGYGERDSGPIPAGSTLLFKVELLDIEKPQE